MKCIDLDGYKIYIAEHLINLLTGFRQISTKTHESGGILLGQIKEKSIYILKISTPSAQDTSSRTSFTRNKQKAQIIIDYEFINSDRKTIYLGEWHTHPEYYPTPSSIDRTMVLDQLKRNELNEPFVLLLILGIKGIFIGKAENGKLLGSTIGWNLIK